MNLPDNVKKNLPYFLLGIIILVHLFIYINTASQLESAPTCLYGCYGTLMNGHLLDAIQNPTNFWESSGLAYDNVPNIFPKGSAYVQAGLYWMLKGAFGWNLFSAWHVTLVYSGILLVGLFLLIFFMLRKLTGNAYIALIGSLLLNFSTSFPTFNTRGVLPQMSFIAFYLIYDFVSKHPFNKKHWLGASLLILLLIFLFNYYVLFVFGFLVWALAFLLVHNHKRWKLFFKDDVNKWLLLIFGIAGLITLLSPWWFNVLIDGPGQNYATSLKLNDDIDYENSSIFFKELSTPLKTFFRFNSIKTSIISLFSLLGLGFLIYSLKDSKIRKNRKHHSGSIKEFGLILLVGYFIASYHYIITVPLLNSDFSPHKLNAFFSNAMIIVLGLIALFELFKRIKFSEDVVSTWSYYVAIAVVVLLSISFFSAQINLYSSEAYNSAKNADSQLTRFVLKNLHDSYFVANDIKPSDTIILSTNEISSVLNSLVGTQLISGRYGFYYQYVDYQKYWFDSSVMLYSNNSDARLDLLKSYSQKGDFYLYWDFYWSNSEYMYNPDGTFRYYYNPAKFYDATYKDLLKSHNISFFEDIQSFEPNTYGGDKYRTFDLAVLSPDNYRSQVTPWNADLDQYLTPVWSYKHQGQTAAVLYKISVS